MLPRLRGGNCREAWVAGSSPATNELMNQLSESAHQVRSAIRTGGDRSRNEPCALPGPGGGRGSCTGLKLEPIEAQQHLQFVTDAAHEQSYQDLMLRPQASRAKHENRPPLTSSRPDEPRLRHPHPRIRSGAGSDPPPSRGAGRRLGERVIKQAVGRNFGVGLRQFAANSRAVPDVLRLRGARPYTAFLPQLSVSQYGDLLPCYHPDRPFSTPAGSISLPCSRAPGTFP
jgi:hypothetical protein